MHKNGALKIKLFKINTLQNLSGNCCSNVYEPNKVDNLHLQLAITDADTWQTNWKQWAFSSYDQTTNNFITLPIPSVDFTQDMVIALSVSGFGQLDINEIIETDSNIEIFITRTEPGGACILPAVVTYPKTTIIKLPLRHKSAVFHSLDITNNCTG